MNEQEIIELYEEGQSTYAIAESYGTYPNKIRRILTKNGINLKTRSQAQKNALNSGRAAHPTDGKERTKSERLKISSSVHKYWDSMSEEEYDKRCADAKIEAVVFDRNGYKYTGRIAAVAAAAREGGLKF